MSYVQIAKEIIKKFEGCELTAYTCPVGIWTIGYGHTGFVVVKGMKITQEEAEKYLEQDIIYFAGVVDRYVKVPLNDQQKASLISFVFNLGDARLKKSTLLKRLNAGDFLGASFEFLKWNKGLVNGKLEELKGLTLRREEEKKIFIS